MGGKGNANKRMPAPMGHAPVGNEWRVGVQVARLVLLLRHARRDCDVSCRVVHESSVSTLRPGQAMRQISRAVQHIRLSSLEVCSCCTRGATPNDRQQIKYLMRQQN